MRRADPPKLKIDRSSGQLIVWRLLGEGTYELAYREHVVRPVIRLTPKSHLNALSGLRMTKLGLQNHMETITREKRASRPFGLPSVTLRREILLDHCSPAVTLLPHMALLPHIAEEPHIALPAQMVSKPSDVLDPHIADEPHMAEDPHIAEVEPTNCVEPQTAPLPHMADVFHTAVGSEDI